LEFDGSPRPRTTRVHWLEVEQRLSADASVRQPAAPEKVAKLSRIEKFSRGRPDFTALTAAPWRGPELIRDPAGRSGISLRQHPAAPFARGGTEGSNPLSSQRGVYCEPVTTVDRAPNPGGLWDESVNFYPRFDGTPNHRAHEWRWPTPLLPDVARWRLPSRQWLHCEQS